MKPEPKPKHPIQKSVRVKVPKRTYQPNRAELREKVDMPGLSLRQVRKASFRPFKFKSD